MYYFGVCYCKIKSCVSLWGWMFWRTGKPSQTYVGDIESRFFLRVFGVEFKVMYWQPKGKRTGLVFPGMHEFTAGFDTQQERDKAAESLAGYQAIRFSPSKGGLLGISRATH